MSDQHAEDVRLREAAEWIVLKHNKHWPDDGTGCCNYCAGSWPCYYRVCADFVLAHIDGVRDAD